MDGSIATDERGPTRPAAARALPIEVEPLPGRPATPPGRLPAPDPVPFAGLPAPTWCPLPALGWQARQSRPSPAPWGEPVALPSPPAPVIDLFTDEVTTPPSPEAIEAPRFVDVDEHGAEHLDPDADEHREGPDDRAVATAPVPLPWDEPADEAPPRARLVPLRIAARALSFAAVGAVVWILVLTTLPRLAGWQPTVITGHSMEPSILRGDVVLVRPAPAAAYAPGAVVTFEDLNHPGRLITHRIVAVRPDGTLTTKGDHNHDADPQSTPVARVRGRAVLRIPYAGSPVIWSVDHDWVPLGASAVLLALAVRTAFPGGRTGGRRRRRGPPARRPLTAHAAHAAPVPGDA